jgi:hypothetical protein
VSISPVNTPSCLVDPISLEVLFALCYEGRMLLLPNVTLELLTLHNLYDYMLHLDEVHANVDMIRLDKLTS